MERLLRNISESYSESDEVPGNSSEPLCITVGEQQNRDCAKNPLNYQNRRDFRSNSILISDIREKCFNRGIDTDFPQHELAREHHDVNRMKMQRQIIELTDNDSKMSLRRLFKMAEIERGNSNLADDAANYENVEILRKLPADTILIKQETKTNKEDSDYTRELTETNSSGGSSSTSGYTIAKVKRIPRAVRNKTRETIEVRRNPMRVSKKDIDKDFPRPRQRLLTNNKRETCVNYESGKRSRLSTMPYMNTRSVTRKMYNVGATYQAPTRKDETEWREWPVHGMHERPVFHPQAGLAVEYLGRYFTSLDGLSYCEIIDGPEIEVVAVDPHCDQRPMSAEKKLKGRTKAKTKGPVNSRETWNSCLSKENKYFETCMHGSLHCVLGYCSQVVTPSYKRIVEDRTMNIMRKIPSTAGISSDAGMKTTNFKNPNTNHVSTNFVENVDKFAEETNLYEGYAIAIAQTAQNKNIVNYMTDRKIATSTPSSSSGIYFPEAQKSVNAELENSKITPQTSGMKLKRILRGAPNSSLILLRSSGAKTNGEISKMTNPIKLENSSMNDDTLMESIYKKFLSSDESLSNHQKSPARNVYNLKKHTMTAEDTVKKAFLENQLENIRTINVMKDTNKNRNINELRLKESDSVISMANSNKNRMWCTNETSEIAKILSEYNRSTTRKSAIQSQTYGPDPRNVKTNLLNTDIRNNFWQKTDRILEDNRNTFIDRNTDHPDHPPRKWRRFQVTLEKPNNTQIIDNNQNIWNSSSMSSDNRQTVLRDRQMKLKILNHMGEKSIESRKNLNEQCDIVMFDAKPEEAIAECCKDGTKTLKTERLQELLENTAVLYCAANGVHQEDLSNYIDTLDSKQSIQWLENWNNHIV